MTDLTKKIKKTIFTLGHSVIPYEVFLLILRQNNIQTLVDIRTSPNSKPGLPFNQKELMEKLPVFGITYHHLKELSNKNRKTLINSPNTGLTKTWQAFADYMLTEEFERGLMQLLALSSVGNVVIFATETDWNKCHRRLLADLLSARGFKIVHLNDFGKTEHALTPRMEMKKDKVVYPAVGEQLRLF